MLRRSIYGAINRPFVASAPSGFAIVNSTSARYTGEATGCTTAALDTTGANLLLMAVGWYASNPNRSDSKGNTWLPLATTNSTNCNGKLYYATAPVVGSGHTFSLNTAGANEYASVCILAVSGSHASPVDNETIWAGTGTTATNGTGITPNQANSLVVASIAIFTGTSPTATAIDGGFSIVQQQNANGAQNIGCALAYRIQTSAALANPNWTLSESIEWATRITAFKPA